MSYINWSFICMESILSFSLNIVMNLESKYGAI